MSASIHHLYLDGSDYYRSLYENYGAEMTFGQAEIQAQLHGLDLHDMVVRMEVGMTPKGMIKTLSLVQGMGY